MTGEHPAQPPRRSNTVLQVRTDRITVLAFAGIAVAGVVAGLAGGWLVLGLARPSSDHLQRAALDEVGLPAELESAPMIGPLLDAYSERVQTRVIDETRPSLELAVVGGVVLAVTVTTALHLAAGHVGLGRTHDAEDTPRQR